MDESINVEHIVAQIRSRIAADAARKVPAAEPNQRPIKDSENLRIAIEEDAARFANLDACLEDSARLIGQQPAAPATWRGWLGGMAISLLRRMLWWYTSPIKESIGHIHARNREQAFRQRQLQEQLLVWARDLVWAAERAQAVERISGVVDRLQRDLVTCNQSIDRLEKRMDQRLLEGTEARDQLKASLVEIAETVAFVKTQAERQELQGTLDWATDRMDRSETAIAQLATQVNEFGSIRSRLDASESTTQQLAAQVRDLANLPVMVSNCGLAIEKQRSSLSVCEHKLTMFLREVRRQLPQPIPAAQLAEITKRSDDPLTELYAEFEDLFRGHRDEIKERHRIYLALLQKTEVGSHAFPVLDLGSGRGEWLELLSENQLIGRGVDRNPTMISRCRERGLNIVESDALDYLCSLPDRSIGAITSFHLVEHLRFDAVIGLIDESLRVLKPGGLLILETPNPQNTLVGSQTFWIDPTHNRPIPSQTLRFFVEARGFTDVEVWPLQPAAETLRLPNDGNALTARFNEYFYGPQDYSVIGQRP